MLRFVVVLLLLAGALYLLFWALDRWRGSGGGRPRPTERPPMGPDDDPDFLRDLEWEQRRRERRPPADPPTDPHPREPM